MTIKIFQTNVFSDILAKDALTYPSKYQVWGVDTKIDFNIPINREEFALLTPSLWGTEDPFKKYRFAIELLH